MTFFLFLLQNIMPVSLLWHSWRVLHPVFFFFFSVISMQDICHNREVSQHTLWICARVTGRVEKWEQCGFYQSWAGLRRWVVHHVLPALYIGDLAAPRPPSTLILCSFTRKSAVLSTFSAVCLQEPPKKEARKLLRTRVHEAKIIFLKKVSYDAHFYKAQTSVEHFCTVIYPLHPSKKNHTNKQKKSVPQIKTLCLQLY